MFRYGVHVSLTNLSYMSYVSLYIICCKKFNWTIVRNYQYKIFFMNLIADANLTYVNK